MNLHGMAAGAIGLVNPFISAVIHLNKGYTTTPSGKQVPDFEQITTSIQRQEITQDDIRRVGELSIQGVACSVYVRGNYAGLVRERQTGADIFEFLGFKWKVAAVVESWPDWCKVIVCQQLS